MTSSTTMPSWASTLYSLNAPPLAKGPPLLQDGNLLEGFPELALGADDADEGLHALLEIGVDGIGVLAARAPEGREELADGRRHRALVESHRALEALDVLGGGEARAPVEDDEVGEGVAA